MTAPRLEDRLNACLTAALQGSPPVLTFGTPSLVQLCYRRHGAKLARVWGQGAGLEAALSDAVARARVLPLRITHIEVTIARPGRLMRQEDLSRARANDFRGLMGIELRAPGKNVRLGPLEMITRNLGPKSALRLLSRQIGLPLDRVQAWAFPADQFLMEWPGARVHALYRGQKTVPPSAITRARVAEMATGMEDWLLAQVGPDGAARYKYWPSSGTYSSANNMVRQFMASAALANIAARRGAGDEIAQRNFSHNFAQFYTEEAGLGLIHEGDKVKLGAAAVALIACLNRGNPAYQPQIAALARFILSMQGEDGAFRSFLRPADRNDCQNFYPGEACLALMRLYETTKDPALLTAVERAFAHYAPLHRADRNPAFVPWHTAALCLYLRHRPHPEMASFVFEMNDWLLGIQQGAGRPADVWGEFFDPARPEFGPPHARATGVYLEGLIEAWDLARRLGHPSSAAYRRAILAGLRSLRQLQFRHNSDMFYLAKKDRVQGGLRTAGYDNTVRLDNVQHALMAIHRILDLWTAPDFRD